MKDIEVAGYPGANINGKILGTTYLAITQKYKILDIRMCDPHLLELVQ
jgi:hypothetical protein